MPLEDPAAAVALTSAAGITAARCSLWVKYSSQGFHCLGLNTVG